MYGAGREESHYGSRVCWALFFCPAVAEVEGATCMIVFYVCGHFASVGLAKSPDGLLLSPVSGLQL